MSNDPVGYVPNLPHNKTLSSSPKLRYWSLCRESFWDVDEQSWEW